MNQPKFRAELLRSLGASSDEVEELLAYNENNFDHPELSIPIKILRPDELFPAAGEEYTRTAGDYLLGLSQL